MVATSRWWGDAWPRPGPPTRTAAAGGAGGAALAAAVLPGARLPTGAVALAIWGGEPDGMPRFVGSRGLGTAEAARWRQVPPQFACHARTAVTEQRQLWLRTGV